MGTVQRDSTYRGAFPVAAGWYSMEVRARHEDRWTIATVERVGVGEVFVVVGHSVAHGGEIDFPGAEDDRVSTIALQPGGTESKWRYGFTGDPRYLPEKDEAKLFANYGTWIEQARKDAGFPNLAVVVNRQSPPDALGQIRRVQERMINEFPNCFPGPDYDTLDKQGKVDGIHLSESGARKAAQLWGDALDVNFFKTAVPLPPK